MRLVIDENLSPRWCDYFAPLGITASHWRDIGNIGDADNTVFDYACGQGAVIVTQDLDFTRMLALRGARLPSVIQLRVPFPVPELVGPLLLQILENHRTQLLAGCLISLESNRQRLDCCPCIKRAGLSSPPHSRAPSSLQSQVSLAPLR